MPPAFRSHATPRLPWPLALRSSLAMPWSACSAALPPAGMQCNTIDDCDTYDASCKCTGCASKALSSLGEACVSLLIGCSSAKRADRRSGLAAHTIPAVWPRARGSG